MLFIFIFYIFCRTKLRVPKYKVLMRHKRNKVSNSISYYLSLTKLLIPSLPAAILNDKVTITTGKPAKIKQRKQGKNAQVKPKVLTSNFAEVKDFILILQIIPISFL